MSKTSPIASSIELGSGFCYRNVNEVLEDSYRECNALGNTGNWGCFSDRLFRKLGLVCTLNGYGTGHQHHIISVGWPQVHVFVIVYCNRSGNRSWLVDCVARNLKEQIF